MGKKELRLDGTLNTQAGTIETTTGGLTVTTNDNGNLTLDPGANNEVEVTNGGFDLNGYNLKSSSPGNVWDLRTSSNVGGSARTFSLEINDDGSSDNDITWKRAGKEDAAFRVVDRTNSNDLLTINDGGDVDVHNGNLDLNGNNVETSSGGLTVTTNDTGNLTLDPGANNELSLSNQSTSSSGNLLAIDGSGNVVEASGTTLSDVGGGSAAWGDGDADNLLEPSDGTKTGVEGINEIRTNNSLTVNIDATDDSTSETFTVQQNTDGTATSLLTVNEGGRVDVNNGNLDLNGNNIRNVGGSESAGSGALRLANGATVTAETNGGGSAIELLKTDASDNVTIGRGAPDNANTVTVQGPHSDDNLKFGGTPGAKLNASGDLELDFDADNSGDSSDSLNVVGSDGSSDVTYFQVKNDGTVTVNNGTLDAQGGTVENTTGALSLSTGSGDLSLQPAGNIDVNSNRISNAKEIHSDNNNITFKGSADVNLDGSILADKGGDLDIISTNSVNVDIDNDNNDTDGTRDFNVTKDEGTTTLFTVNDGGEVDIFQGDLDMNSSGSVVNTSDARAKTAIEPIAHPIEKLTELQPRTYEWKAEETADGREAGVIAQSVEDVLPEAVQEDEDGFLKLAYRQLTPLVIGAVQEQQTEIENLEADLDDKDDRIDTLEAENEQLRERNAELEDRLATVEAELGIDASAGQQGVADD